MAKEESYRILPPCFSQNDAKQQRKDSDWSDHSPTDARMCTASYRQRLMNNLDFLAAGAFTSSVIADFYVKSTGRSGLYGTWTALPLIPLNGRDDITARYLALNCLTKDYAALWEGSYSAKFNAQLWSQPESPRLHQRFFQLLTPTWQRNCALRKGL